MRDELEIQRAHDILRAVEQRLLVGVTRKYNPLLFEITAAADVLCWILNHQNSFAETLKQFEEHLAEIGFEIVDSGKLNYPNGEGPVH